MLVSLFVGLFVVAFLFVFEPFGFGAWNSKDKIIHFSVFGLMSWLIPFFLVLLLKRGFPKLEKNWKVWKEIGSMLLFILAIAAGCYVYLILIKAVLPSVHAFLIIILNVLLIAFFPALANVYTIHRNHLTEHLRKASEMNQSLPVKELTALESVITILAENQKDTFEFETASVLYIQSADNYVEVVFLSGYALKKTLIRTSLKRVEDQMPPDLVRCHRSTIVNLKQVQSVAGNAQGYKISFRESSESVVVSRKYAQKILVRLKKF